MPYALHPFGPAGARPPHAADEAGQVADWSSFGRTRPAAGGIKAQHKQFGTHWWSRRWLEALALLCDEGRLTRGRSYARRGQVVDLTIQGGEVRARVQGSSATPYRTLLIFTPWTAAEQAAVEELVSADAALTGALLGGDLPEAIEAALGERGLSLFPTRRQVETHCSCPDWGDPCKHGAATYCLLTEEIDRDPWVLLALRGMDREAWLERLGLVAAEVEPPEPLDPETFWKAPPLPRLEPGRRPQRDGSAPRLLGPFPLWRGETPFFEATDALYRQLSDRAEHWLDVSNAEPLAAPDEVGTS